MYGKSTPKVRPPDAESCERALIGAVLGNPERVWPIVSKRNLGVDAFADGEARQAWGAITRLSEAGSPIDEVTVKSESGLPALTLQAIIDSGIPAHCEYYADAIRARAIKRAALSAISQADGAEAIRLALRQIEETLPETDSGGGELKSLATLAAENFDTNEVLIGNAECRYHERGAILLVSGPAGTGKSHITGQCLTSFAQGKAAFGLPPVRPLRCLSLQAENPSNDARAIARVMTRDLTPEALKLIDENTRQLWLPGCTGDSFLSQAAALLRRWPADIVFIDPLLAFSPGDLREPKIVQSFCRQGLSNLAFDFGVGLFITHHVPKPSANRDPSKMGAYDFQYAASGNADLAANWPRCALGIQPLARGEFLLRATKRRPPWKSSTGEQVWEIGIRHTEGGHWETFEADAESVRTGRPTAPPLATYRAKALQVAAEVCPCTKGVLADALWGKVIGARNRSRDLLDMLVAESVLTTERGTGKGSPTIVKLTGAGDND